VGCRAVHRLDEFVHQLEYLGDVACVGDAVNEGRGANKIRACATCSTARLKASSLAFEGFVNPLNFRTN